MKKFLKMEDRLHFNQTRAKQWLNDHQYFILLGTHEHPKYDGDRGWQQSVDVNRYILTPGQRWSPY
jgi:hypothetical protein